MIALQRFLSSSKSLRDGIVRALFVNRERQISPGTSYASFYASCLDVASALEAWNGGGKRDVHIGVVGPNGLPWLSVDVACALAQKTVVGIHMTWPEDEAAYVLGDADVALLIVCPGTPDHVRSRLAASCASLSIPVIDYADLLQKHATSSASSPHEGNPFHRVSLYSRANVVVDEDYPHTLMYTSGTTNWPKGVVVSRARWLADALTGSVSSCAAGVHDPSVVSYNPFAHGADRGLVYQAMFAGCTIWFATDDTLLKVLPQAKPVVFLAFASFWADLFRTLSAMEPAKVKVDVFGGRVAVVGTGGTFTAPTVWNWLQNVFVDAAVIDAYGATEFPGISSNGQVPPNVDVKIDAETGEILVRYHDRSRKPSRYWKREDDQAWDQKEGWFHTGDVGSFDPVTRKLEIVDRLHDLTELYVDGRSQWISASQLESVFGASPFVHRVYIHGDRMRESVIAVVIPKQETDKEHMLSHLQQIARKNSLKSWETPKGVVLEMGGADAWTADNGLLSSSGKLKRGALAAKYRDLLEEEFSSIESTTGGTLLRRVSSGLSLPSPQSWSESPFVSPREVWKDDAAFVAGRNAAAIDWIDFSFTGRTEMEGYLLNQSLQPLKKQVLYIREHSALWADWRDTLVANAEKRLLDIQTTMQCDFDQMTRCILSVTEANEFAQLWDHWLSAALVRKAAVLAAHRELFISRAHLHPEFLRALAQYRDLSARLEHLAADLKVEVPFMIKSGLWLRDPAQTSTTGQDFSVGGENVYVWCDFSGQLIEEGFQDRCRPRYVSLERSQSDDPSTAITFSVSSWDVIQSVLQASSGRTRDTYGQQADLSNIFGFDVYDFYVVEHQSHFWAQDAVKDPSVNLTLGQVLRCALKTYGARPCLGEAEWWSSSVPSIVTASCNSRNGYRWLTFAQVGQLVSSLAWNIQRLVAQPSDPSRSNTTRVGIVGANSIEWLLCDFACTLIGITPVGIHTTYEQAEAAHVLSLLDCGLLFVLNDKDGRTRIAWDVQAACQEARVRHVVACQPEAYPLLNCSALSSWLEPLSEPSELVAPPRSLDSECTILFTSGSTGVPSGVVMPEATLLAELRPRVDVIPLSTASYVPLSHSSDRIKAWQFVLAGGRVGVAHYDPSNWRAHETAKKSGMVDMQSGTSFNVGPLFREYISKLQPSAMSCPSRIWHGLYALAQAESMSDEQVRALFGPNIKFLATGGSKTRPEVLVWARRVFDGIGLHIVDSYGTTETGAITEDGYAAEHVGAEFKVVDVPELGFVFPRGEIYARTRTMAREYFKNPQKTAAAFTEDGWFRTGDIGEVHFDEASPGRPHLSVIERRSAIVALKSGAILCPSEVEALLEQYPGVSVAIVAASPHLDHPRCVVESSQLAADHCLKLAAHLKAHGIDEAVIPDAWKFVVPEHESAPSRLLTGEMKQNRRSILATLLAPSANGDNSWHSSATHP